MSGPSGPESSGADKHSRADETDIHSRAYSAPESEQFSSAPYVPPDPALYDYDDYALTDEQGPPPRWPWVVGVVAIIAAVALVASVALLVTRTDNTGLANPQTSTSTAPPVQDAITTTPPPPPPSEEPPPPPSEEPPPRRPRR